LEKAITKENKEEKRFKKKVEDLEKKSEQDSCVIDKEDKEIMTRRMLMRRMKNFLKKEADNREEMKKKSGELGEMLLGKFGNDREQQDRGK